MRRARRLLGCLGSRLHDRRRNVHRGYQFTGAAGRARCVTIYPGWYPGRTVHVHFKIRANETAGRALEFTSQLFFDDALSDEVFTREPYSTKGERSTRNANDWIYNRAGDQCC
ncbi:MAG: hypothetical protein WEB13_06690 [Dehalococcoidia bacterium]